MKKIALAAVSATALLALSACGDAAEEPVVEETTVIDTAPVEPIVEETVAVDPAATDEVVEEATEETMEEAPAE